MRSLLFYSIKYFQKEQVYLISKFILGQLVDSVATPFIGVLIDKYSTKKKWNALGNYND